MSTPRHQLNYYFKIRLEMWIWVGSERIRKIVKFEIRSTAVNLVLSWTESINETSRDFHPRQSGRPRYGLLQKSVADPSFPF
jgi:hypothetical protein